MNSHLAQISMSGNVAVERAQPHHRGVADEVGDVLGHPAAGAADRLLVHRRKLVAVRRRIAHAKLASRAAAAAAEALGRPGQLLHGGRTAVGRQRQPQQAGAWRRLRIAPATAGPRWPPASPATTAPAPASADARGRLDAAGCPGRRAGRGRAGGRRTDRPPSAAARATTHRASPAARRSATADRRRTPKRSASGGAPPAPPARPRPRSGGRRADQRPRGPRPPPRR